jgi:hypothetical protein
MLTESTWPPPKKTLQQSRFIHFEVVNTLAARQLLRFLKNREQLKEIKILSVRRRAT